MKIQKVTDEIFIVDGEDAVKLALSPSDHCREVFVSKSYCLKIGYQNICEFSIWKSLEEKDKKYFAEILFYNKKYLVQRRYFNKNFPRNKIVRDMLVSLCNKYKIDDVIDEERNYFMVAKNHPLIVDYGLES